MNVDQTLEALIIAINAMLREAATISRRDWRDEYKSNAITLQSLHDNLPALIAAREALIRLGHSSAGAITGLNDPEDMPTTVEQCVAAIEAEQALGRERSAEANALRADAETLRKMKEAGPVAEVVRPIYKGWGCDVLWEYHAKVQPGTMLYTLPDEVTK